MARVLDVLASEQPSVSFEFFPPKTDEGDRNLRDTIQSLEPLDPTFVSVTYGAGGSTRDRTHRIVTDIAADTSLTPMAHLTGFAHTRSELVEILSAYREAGVDHVLALRGDPPRDQPDAEPGEIAYALDLVALAREVGDFTVGVAAQPDLHPLSPDRESDRRHLARKLQAADVGITQFFHDAEAYVRMVDELADLGCDTPVLPGIMPVTQYTQVELFPRMNGQPFPTDLAARLELVKDDPAEVRRIGVEVATEMCVRLLDAGAPGLHFYTLNRSTATREIHTNLGL